MNGNNKIVTVKKLEEIAKYLFEIGTLKRTPRSGWEIAGIKNPETVAEHSFRTAIIAYILAKLENADLGNVLTISLIHDTLETRILDLHQIAKHYLNLDKCSEEQIISEQTEMLPEHIKNDIRQAFRAYLNHDSTEGKIARDADKLEMLLQAIEYKKIGYHVDDWIKSAIDNLILESSKKLAKEILTMNPSDWYKNI